MFKKIMALCFMTLCVLLVFSGDFCFYTIIAESENCEKSVELPIIMYHSIMKSITGKYCVSPHALRQDIQYLKEHGYESVFLSQVVAYCEGIGQLPEKPVVLSFDDGHYNNYYYAYPILKELGFKANLNVIGCFSEFTTSSGDIDNPNYSYITWDEIKELHDSGVFEIGNHTYNMHKYVPRFGVAQKADEDDVAYKQNLTADVLRLENKLGTCCGIRSQVFAYPFGKYNKLSTSILKELGFKAFLTCNEGVNKLEKDKCKTLETLKRINRNGNLSTWQTFSKYNIK